MGFREEIAKVAYELYEKRGKGDGCHIDDWVEAEKIVMARHARKEEGGVKLARSGRTTAASKSAKEEKAKPARKSTSARKKTSVKKAGI